MFEAYAKAIAQMDMVPLRVECNLLDDVATYDALHLDAILAYSVVEEVTHGEMLDTQEYIQVPLPLDVLFTNHRGIPMFACTNLVSVGEAARAIRYWHKRAMEPHMTTRNIRTTQGSHKEKRVPLPTLTNRTLVADCIGNANEIARLLSKITAVGKKRNMMGAVASWRIYPITKFSLLDDVGRTLREVPWQYAVKSWNGADINMMAHIGFSPPYWHAATKDMCIQSGSKVL